MFVFPYHLFCCEEKYLNLSFDSSSPMAGIVVCVARLCVSSLHCPLHDGSTMEITHIQTAEYTYYHNHCG